MTHRRPSSAILTIKQRVRDGLYWLTDHAIVEMDDDSVRVDDLRHAIAKGRLVRRQTGDSRGTRYLIQGPTLDGRPLVVVCVLDRLRVRIITVYVVR